MRIELPGGDWVELRDADRLTGGDRRAYKAAMKFKITPSADGTAGMQEISGDVQERQRNAVLRRLIVAWAVRHPGTGQMYPIPISQPPDDPDPILDDIPLDVYDTLIEAIAAHMDKLESAGKSSRASGEPSPDSPPPQTPPTSDQSL